MFQVLELAGSVGEPRRVAREPVERMPDALASVAGSLSALEREIAVLWRDTIDLRDDGWSERLAELSHALRRAAVVLQAEPMIGLASSGPRAAEIGERVGADVTWVAT